MPEHAQDRARQSVPAAAAVAAGGATACLDADSNEASLQYVLEQPAPCRLGQDDVAAHELDTVLQLSAHSCCELGLSAWHFVLVRCADKRRRLAQASGDARLLHAPVLVIVLGAKDDVERYRDAILERETAGTASSLQEASAMLEAALEKAERLGAAFYRQHRTTALAITRLAAAAHGLDALVVEHFDAQQVRHDFGVANSIELIALLALGQSANRLAAASTHVSFTEHYGDACAEHARVATTASEGEHNR